MDAVVGFIQGDVFQAVLLPFGEDLINFSPGFDVGGVKGEHARGGLDLEDSGEPVLALVETLLAGCFGRFGLGTGCLGVFGGRSDGWRSRFWFDG